MKEDNNNKLLEDQKNKKHRAIRDKIKKRRDNIKEKTDFKKEKKLKHKQKVLEHNGQVDNVEEVVVDKGVKREIKLKKKIKSFLELFKDDLNEFYDLFDQLDNFQKIDISDMENNKIKKILSKIFKYLKKEIKFNEETNEYSKLINKNQSLPLKTKIQRLTFKIIEDENNKDMNSQSDSEIEEQGQKNQKKRIKKFKQNEEEQIKIDQTRFDFLKKDVLAAKLKLEKENQKFKKSEPKKIIKGPTMISEEEKQKFINQSLHQSKRDSDLQGDYLNDILDQSQSYNKLSTLNKTHTIQEQTQEEKDKEQGIRDFMKEYDAKFRNKSLSEQHQEKLKQKKQVIFGDGKVREEFDRVRDMQVSKHDSKQIFKLLNQGNGSLKSKFSNSTFSNSFI